MCFKRTNSAVSRKESVKSSHTDWLMQREAICRGYERLLEWEAEQIVNGNEDKLFELQAAIMTDVRKIFGEKSI